MPKDDGFVGATLVVARLTLTPARPAVVVSGCQPLRSRGRDATRASPTVLDPLWR